MKTRTRQPPPEREDYNGLKRRWTEDIALLAIAAKLKPAPVPAVLAFTWHEPDKMRDKDNVRGGAKLILDGLVAAKVLRDDGNRYVLGFAGDYYVYPGSAVYRGPGIDVWIGAGPIGAFEGAVKQRLWIPHRLPDMNAMGAAREYGARKSVYRRGRGAGDDSFTALARRRGLIP